MQRTADVLRAADFQGHGRTNDIDRSLNTRDLASDVIGLLEHLGVRKVDVFGFSVEERHLSVSPQPDREHLKELLDKLGRYDAGTGGGVMRRSAESRPGH